jgi:hypothetical protein
VLDEERLDRLGAVVSAIVEGMDGGVYPANPGDDAVNCTWCPFDRICPADRDDEWVRVRHGKAFAPYVKLASGTVGSDTAGSDAGGDDDGA